ncbi:hypothetical protein M1L60_00790 [Actinoplanes sp. TRM 88003]|uniref:Uncharacterized protein n=1 Tax=Paractinoplanes aksuensis TaxID=2939490 RepID=A0ABT1DE97_9ACTN|nr:hypothetical protein [Actinoplanes aksuensis]MCO8269120.1 hypothetical protein [Actinoplanes aksuensis]
MKLWNIPAWAWITGIVIGTTISLMMFDDLIIAAMFGVSIGTAFAIAFGATSSARRE